MSIVNTLDRIAEWVEKEICPEIKLKVPPDHFSDEDAIGYDYKTENPSVFIQFFPTKDKLPPGILSEHPGICVLCTGGEEGRTEGKADIQLTLSSWDPGFHGKDIYIPEKNDNLNVKQWSGAEAENYYKRSYEGWRDAWNMVDIALRKIESVTNINGLLIDAKTPIKYGPIQEQGAVIDFYPLWFAWIGFSVRYPILRNIEGLEELL